MFILMKTSQLGMIDDQDAEDNEDDEDDEDDEYYGSGDISDELTEP